MIGRLLGASFAPEVRASLGLLTAARLGANSIYRFAPPFLAVIAADLDVSLTTLGVVLAVSELVGLAGPFVGRIAERLPRRGTMVGGLACVAGGAALAGAAPGPAALAVALVVVAVSKMFFDVSLMGWVSERVPYGQRGRAIGLTETSWAGGLLVGVPVMGLVTAAASWRWGFATGAFGVVLLAAVLHRRLPGTRHVPEPPEPPPATSRQPSLLPTGAPTRPRLGAGWLLIVSMGAMLGSAQAIVVVFGPWLEERHGFGVLGLAAVVVALGAGELVASLATASRADRLGKARSMSFGVAVMIPSAAMLAVFDDVLVIGLIVLIVFMVGFEFAIVSSIPMATELLPGAPAAGLGMTIGAGTFGRALVAIPATATFERYGVWVPAVLAVGLASIALVTIGSYRRKRPAA